MHRGRGSGRGSRRGAARAALVAVGGALLLAVAATAGDAGASGAPRIHFDATQHDFGEIPSDRTVEHVWTFRNEGDAPLEILRTITSCGCTMTLVDEKVVPPGGTGGIHVKFDPAGQEGSVRKNLSVVSTDPDRVTTLLTLRATVIPVEDPTLQEGGHPRITGQSLLMGECASCHAAPAAGKQGDALYAVVCAMCHGARADGGRAPSLRHPSYLDQRSDDELQQAIAFGTANPRMPGFSELMGGPLSDPQIRSLVEMLRRWGSTTEAQGGATASGG